MSDDIAIKLEEREILGKGLTKLRADGLIPAVIHDHGNPSIHVMGNDLVLGRAYVQAGKHHPVHLKVGGKNRLALIKDVDFEPTKHKMRHIVFQAIRQDEETEAEIPVVFKAEAEIPAEKKSLLVLKQLDHVEIKALPKDLPDELVVDPSILEEVGDSLTVADIVVPAGVTIMAEPELQIAVVEMPKDQEAEANAAAAEMAAEKAEAEGGEEEAAPTEESAGDAEATETTEAKQE